MSVAEKLNGAAALTSLRVRRFDTIQAKAVEWLWPGRIPSKLTMFAGMPGLGKSQVTIAVTATVSTGGRWPTGEPAGERRVILIGSEDSAEDTVKPRLIAAGAKLENVEIVDGDTDEEGKPIAWTLDAIDKLAAYCRSHEHSGTPVGLIVIDPISAYLGRHDGHNQAEVRGLLAPLLELADALGIAVIAISHLNKSEGSHAANRISGSGAYVQAARAALVVGEHPEIEGACCIAGLKSNLSKMPPGIGYRVVPYTTADGIGTSRVEWIEGAVDVTADDLLAPARRETEADLDLNSAKGDAARFLVDLLRDGPVTSTAVYAAAEQAGIDERTLKRAKKTLHARSVKPGGVWHWELATRASAHEADAEAEPAGQGGQVDPPRNSVPLVPLDPVEEQEGQGGQEGQGVGEGGAVPLDRRDSPLTVDAEDFG